jgi:hypothetical protein
MFQIKIYWTQTQVLRPKIEEKKSVEKYIILIFVDIQGPGEASSVPKKTSKAW